MSTLTPTNLNFPDNPITRRFLELIGEYQVRYVLLEEGVRFTAPDLSEAKGHYKGDFKDNFLSNMTTRNSENSSLNPNDVWVLERDDLKDFKDIYKDQLGISLGRINKITVVGWNTAYRYLIQGYSEAAKDFSNLGAASVAESFQEESQNQHQLPQNYIEALKALVSSEKQKQLTEANTQQVEGKLGEN